MSDLSADRCNRARFGANRPLDLLEHAVRSALALNELDRGWALVRLAAAFHDHGRTAEAFRVLDHVERFSQDEHLLCAAFTCAIEIHSELGVVSKAIVLVDQQRAGGRVDLVFLRAEVRARFARWEATRDEQDRAALDRARDELGLAEALSSVAA